MRERIVVLDGAMGTMIQGYKLSEADYRGERFRDWKGKDLKGSLELLNLTQPQVIEEIHSELSRGRRGYHRNQHLQRNNHRLCTISCFKANPHVAAKIRNSFSAWWTMPVFARLVHEINFEAAQDRAPRCGPGRE